MRLSSAAPAQRRRSGGTAEHENRLPPRAPDVNVRRSMVVRINHNPQSANSQRCWHDACAIHEMANRAL